MAIIHIPEEPHSCRVGDLFRGTDRLHGSIAQCDKCGTFYQLIRKYQYGSPEYKKLSKHAVARIIKRAEKQKAKQRFMKG